MKKSEHKTLSDPNQGPTTFNSPFLSWKSCLVYSTSSSFDLQIFLQIIILLFSQAVVLGSELFFVHPIQGEIVRKAFLDPFYSYLIQKWHAFVYADAISRFDIWSSMVIYRMHETINEVTFLLGFSYQLLLSSLQHWNKCTREGIQADLWTYYAQNSVLR